MRWFRNTESIYYGDSGSSSDDKVYNVVVGPYKYNNLLYGTETNLMYEARLAGNILDQYYQIYPVDGVSINYRYQRVVGVVDDRDLSTAWDTEEPNAKISGKYRVEQNLSGRFFGGVSIPIKGVCIKVDGTRLDFDSIWSISESQRFPNYSYCGIVFKSIKNETTVASFGSVSQNTTSFEVPEEFVGVIFDFGKVEQNIPKFLKDWIEANFTRIYENTYTVKDTFNGETRGVVSEAPPIKKMFLNNIEGFCTLILTGTNDQNYDIEWRTTLPALNVTFLGLSLYPNSKIAQIPVGKEVNISLDNNTTFYEVYGDYRPLPNSLDIELYRSSAETNRLDKTNYIEQVGIVNGVLRTQTSIIDLVINIQIDYIPDFNYVRIPIFNRYYFVADIVSIRNNLWEITLECDVLMSYKDAIRNCQAFIERNENTYDKMLVDKEIPLEQGKIIEYTAIPNNLFSAGNFQFVLQGLMVSASEDIITQ